MGSFRRTAPSVAVLVGALSGSCGAPAPASEGPSDAAVPPLWPEPRSLPARYPIVLIPGLDGRVRGRWEFRGVAEALARDGHWVEVAPLPWGEPDERAQVLAARIDGVLLASGRDKVNLVAHSLGGLDARAVIGLGYARRVASITTVGTPHYGTSLAVRALGRAGVAPDAAPSAAAMALGVSSLDVLIDPAVRDVLTSMTPDFAARFAATHLEAPGVYYQSWAGVSTPGGRWDERVRRVCGRLPGYVLRADALDDSLVPAASYTGEGPVGEPHDGVVRVTSARWGTFRGCVPADHLDLVGQGSVAGANPHTGYDPVAFYRWLVADLAQRGY